MIKKSLYYDTIFAKLSASSSYSNLSASLLTLPTSVPNGSKGLKLCTSVPNGSKGLKLCTLENASLLIF